jgi:Uma2 family endonuclease
MPRTDPATWTLADYERAAGEYCASLPPEHFMEATTQSRQRAITLASLALVSARRPDVQVCNELLVQYPINAHLGQVVPDNMVVLDEEPIQAMGSFNLPFESVQPFWVLEYVSQNSERKDYEENFPKYEQELRVPYYLVFHPEKQDLRLYHHNGVAYDRVTPNPHGPLPIPEIDLEIGLLDGWARFWYQGELLPLPADLQQQLDELKARLEEAERQAERERRKARREKTGREKQKQRADALGQRLNQEKQRADALGQQVNHEKQRADQAEQELQRLRAQLEQLQAPKPSPGKRKKRPS